MVETQVESKINNEWLKLVGNRADIPNGALQTDYQKDVDLLVILLSDKPSVKSRMDYENDVLFNYDKNGKLASIEVLDLYGIFV